MRKGHLVLILMCLLAIGLPMAVTTLGVDVEAKGGARESRSAPLTIRTSRARHAWRQAAA
jgi:hypothetical protein